jgi:tetratricopeptide (TPR) repeat protein
MTETVRPAGAAGSRAPRDCAPRGRALAPRILAPRILAPRILAMGLAALLAASCSTAPKTTAVYDVRNKAAGFVKLGDSFMARNVYDQAAKYYEEALEADQSIDYIEGVARCHVSIGRAWLAAGDPAKAEREFRDGLEYGRMAASPGAQALATAGLGEVAWARGDREGALALFEQAVVIAGKDQAALAIALHDEATALAGLGRGAEAEAGLAKAASINAKAGRWSEVGANRYVLASILSKAGRYDEALAQAGLALEADRKVENGPGMAKDLAALATISQKMDRKQAAFDYWRRSFDTALASNMPEDVRRALVSLVALAGELDRGDDAARYAALLARLEASMGAAVPSAAPLSPAAQ